ncbi:MAG: ABC transporter permease [Bacteroidales bacterium]|nr:ABC transporter permease [Bacteroidales bacterium]
MFGNFFKVALRVFLRDRTHTLINIFGLAIGLAFSLVIFLYAHKEINYDRFHQDARQIYRVVVDGKIAENQLHHAVTSYPLAPALTDEITGIESSVRIARFGAWLVRYGNVRYNEDNMIFTDPDFFRFFSFPLISGKADEVLRDPKSIVLSRQAAQRYFGNENPVGKLLRIENDSTYYKVTGVMEDVPENSHLYFDMVATLSTYQHLLAKDSWISHFLYTYYKTGRDASPEQIAKGLERIAEKYIIPQYKGIIGTDKSTSWGEGNYYRFYSQPLTAIHLRSAYTAEFQPGGKIMYIYFFIVVAIVILVLACINFISLVTAHSVNRAREVGIRKMAGSERSIIIRQFLVESSLLAFFSMALALLITELILPAFSEYIGLHLSLGQLLNSAGILLMILLILIIGLVSGLYPAWYLSSFHPGQVLRNRLPERKGRGLFRHAVSVFQLFLTLATLTMSMIIFYQFRYLINKDRGYDTENLLVIRRSDGLAHNLEAYKNAIAKHPGVISVTNTTAPFGGIFPRSPYIIEGHDASQNFSLSHLLVSYGFDSTYNIPLAAGRFFSRGEPGDSMSCLINQTAARLMDIDNPLGKSLVPLTAHPGKKQPYKIIGVMNDFHFETLENPIRPLIVVLVPGIVEGYLTVKLAPENQDSTVKYLESVWNSHTSAYPFVSYSFSSDFKNHYMPVRTTARVFLVLSVVTLLMACLSLFSLISYLFFRKQREIGIQKTMGASQQLILWNHLRRVLLLVIIAAPPAWLGAWYLANSWLNDYAYHIRIGIGYFASGLAIVAFSALVTIYYHSCQAARLNPGKTLKYE